MEKKDTIIVNMFRDAPWPGNTLSNLDNRGQRAINSKIIGVREQLTLILETIALRPRLLQFLVFLYQ